MNATYKTELGSPIPLSATITVTLIGHWQWIKYVSIYSKPSILPGLLFLCKLRSILTVLQFKIFWIYVCRCVFMRMSACIWETERGFGCMCLYVCLFTHQPISLILFSADINWNISTIPAATKSPILITNISLSPILQTKLKSVMFCLQMEVLFLTTNESTTLNFLSLLHMTNFIRNMNRPVSHSCFNSCAFKHERGWDVPTITMILKFPSLFHSTF